MLIGILAGLATGALWGLTFIAPRMVDPFATIDLVIARYLAFGVMSALLMINPRFRPGKLSRSRLVTGLVLGMVGYVGYFLTTAYAVRFAGAVLPPLIIGTMPVLLALIANWRERAVPWRALLAPLGLIAAGLVVVNAHAFSDAVPAARDDTVLGVLLSVLALAIWVGYGLVNAQVMRAPDAPDGLRWTGLQGIGAAAGSLLLLAMSGLPAVPEATPHEIWRFVVWSLGMAVVGSWFATWCWVVASKRLPLALTAQLIIAETVFGLGYGLAFEQRWPTNAESIGILLQLAGVIVAVAIFTRRRVLTPAAGNP